MARKRLTTPPDTLSDASASCVPGLEPQRSPCPITSALDLLGDKWTLVVIRDLLFLEKRRFADLLSSPEGISTNILAERLDRLEAGGIVERRQYQDHPPRDEYLLTEKGRELRPVLAELVRWGLRHIRGTALPSA
ncbi:MAG: helix-turn-helix domain-containing protein, partial [Vicinamibacterales bacterium]